MNEEMLHAYLDGELGADDRAIVDRAIAGDAKWAEAYATLRSVDAAIGTLPGVTVEDDGDAMARAAMKPEPRGRLLRLVLPAAAAAAALFLALLPENRQESRESAVFTESEQAQYLYWEADAETYGTGDLTQLESEILAALEPS